MGDMARVERPQLSLSPAHLDCYVFSAYATKCWETPLLVWPNRTLHQPLWLYIFTLFSVWRNWPSEIWAQINSQREQFFSKCTEDHFGMCKFNVLEKQFNILVQLMADKYVFIFIIYAFLFIMMYCAFMFWMNCVIILQIMVFCLRNCIKEHIINTQTHWWLDSS